MTLDTLCPWCFSPKDADQCRECAWNSDEKELSPLYLNPGTILHEQYQIGRVLGHGGFGITYLAYDLNLQIKVALKEYLPKDFATRAQAQTSISVFDGSAGQSFAYGLDQFIDEARILARFQQHPGVVSVLNFFRAHGTGYIAMEYVAGITLKEHLQTVGKIPFPEALQIMMPVMDALREVHDAGLLHRDISPDNIFISQDGMVKLLDFGAARFAMGERSRSLSVILKPGYAPEEQYRTRGQQGAWTDVYALCATFYRMITGHLPVEALDRIEDDDLERPSALGVAIPARAEEALFHGLAVRARHRYQSIAELQTAWLQDSGSIQPVPAETKANKKKPTTVKKTSIEQVPKSKKSLWLIVVACLGLLIVGAVYLMQNVQNSTEQTKLVEKETLPNTSIPVSGNTSLQDADAGSVHVLKDDVYAQPEETQKSYALTIQTQPKNARVRILNIKPSYVAGMLLESGKYHIEVSQVGYQEQRQWVEIIDQALDVEIVLADALAVDETMQAVQGHQAAIHAISVSPNGKYVVSASADQTLILWNAKSKQMIRQFKGHVGSVNAVSFSRNSARFVSGGDDKILRIWDVQRGKQVQQLTGHSKPITDVVFAIDGKIVSVAKDQTLRLWNVDKGVVMRKFSGHNFLAVALSPQGRFAVSPAGIGSELRIWDLIDGGSVLRMKGHRSIIKALSFSPDGKFIASASKDKSIRLWHAFDQKDQSSRHFLSQLSQSNAKLNHSLQVLKGHTKAVNDVAFSPDAKRLVSASDDHSVRVWDVKSGKLLRTFSEHHAPVLSVTFSADGKQVISGDAAHQLIFRALK